MSTIGRITNAAAWGFVGYNALRGDSPAGSLLVPGFNPADVDLSNRQLMDQLAANWELWEAEKARLTSSRATKGEWMEQAEKHLLRTRTEAGTPIACNIPWCLANIYLPTKAQYDALEPICREVQWWKDNMPHLMKEEEWRLVDTINTEATQRMLASGQATAGQIRAHVGSGAWKVCKLFCLGAFIFTLVKMGIGAALITGLLCYVLCRAFFYSHNATHADRWIKGEVPVNEPWTPDSAANVDDKTALAKSVRRGLAAGLVLTAIVVTCWFVLMSLC